jgi:beta-glucanase (GH16 family)
MKTVLNFIILLVFLPNALSAQRDTILPVTNLCNHGGWKLVFSDEFNGRSLDRSKWVTYFPYADNGSDSCDFCRTHGDEGQVYSDANVEPSGGTLKLYARREQSTWFDVSREYTSGMIHSIQAFGQGRYEIRCKLPKGMGFWTAFWMFGEKATEIDVLEAGMQKPRHMHMGIKTWKNGNSFDKSIRSRTDLSEGFHLYALEWDENFIRIEVDSSEVWRISRYLNQHGKTLKYCEIKAGKYRLQPAWPPEGEKLKIIVNLAIGTQTTPFTKSPGEKTVIPNQMEIDWIRVYEKRENSRPGN